MSWKKFLYFLLIVIPCQTLPQTVFEAGGGLKVSPLFLLLPFFNRLYSNYASWADPHTNSLSTQKAGIYPFPDAHTTLKALLIPDDLPDWHLQHLYQQWQQIHFPHHYPQTGPESTTLPRWGRNRNRGNPPCRIYLSLINQQLRIVIQPSSPLSMPVLALLAERTLNTLRHFYQILLDRHDIPGTAEPVVSSAAAGGDGGGDDPYDPYDPYDPKDRGKFDFFVYQSDTDWQPLFLKLRRQQLLKQSIQKKRRLLAILRQRVRQAVNSGHEQLARILQDRIMVVEVDEDELLYQMNSQSPEFHSNEALLLPLLQNLLQQADTLEKEEIYSDMYFPPPEDGGGKGQSKKGMPPQDSRPQDKKGKRPRQGGNKEAPPGKKHRQQPGDGGGGWEGGESGLSDEQLFAGIPYQLQLDIAWEFKDDIALFGQACAVVENSASRQLGPYIRAFIFIRECLTRHKIESVVQLVRRLSKVGKEFKERLTRVICEYRVESIPIEGEYSDFYSFLSLNTLPFLPELSTSIVTGLQLGLPLEQIQKMKNQRNRHHSLYRGFNIFKLYKDEHPRTLLARFFPLLKKALLRMGKPEWYEQIYTAFTTWVSLQENSKQPLADQGQQSVGGKAGISQSQGTAARKTSLPQSQFTDVNPVIACGKYLSPEVWTYIFNFMDLDTLFACRLVCKTFYEIVDHPVLLTTNSAIARCISKKQCLNNETDKERVGKSFWFHSTNWPSVLAARKTHPEIIRRCISNPCFLASYLWENQYLLKLRVLNTFGPWFDYGIDQIASDYNQHAAGLADCFSVVINCWISIVHLTSDQICHTQTCKLKLASNLGGHYSHDGRGVYMQRQTSAIVVPDNRGLFVTFGKDTLHIWNVSRPKTECLQGVISHIDCATVLKTTDSHIIVTAFTDSERFYLQSYEIQNSPSGGMAVPSQKIPVPYCVSALRTMHGQTKLIVVDSQRYLSVWELNVEGSLCNTVARRNPVGEDKDISELYFSSTSFGNTLCGLVNGCSATGWNSDLDIIFVLEARYFRKCVDMDVIDDTILVLALPGFVRLFGCDKEGKMNHLMTHHIDLAWAPKITAMTVLDKNHLLLGFQDGEVSLYLLPLLPSFYSAFRPVPPRPGFK